MEGLVPGTIFAGYRVEASLGRGGMGVVYRCTDLKLGRLVALKLIVEELAQNVAFRERFERESRLAAAIDHPNVIPIYEAGEAEHRLFISMRYVEGTDLRALITEVGRLEPAEAVHIVSQVAAALDAAHERGIVHRDVKPANVLITGEDERQVYLSDFGLVKEMTSAPGITRAGQVIGTADYCSPEQIKNERLDARADVYSLGCVLFECLTGLPPYRRESEVATIWAHLNDPSPRPTDVLPTVGEGFDAVIAKAMEKDRENRFASAGDLGRAARAALAGVELPPDSHPVATGDAAFANGKPVPAAGREASAEPAVVREDERGASGVQTLVRLRVPAVIPIAFAAALVVVLILVRVLGGGGNGPPASDLTTTSIPVGQGPSGLAVDGTNIWVANTDSNTLTRIDARSNSTVGAETPAGESPVGIAAGRGQLWVTTTGDASVRRIETSPEPGAGQSIAVGNGPTGVALSPKYAWVASQSVNTVTRIDRASGSIVGAPVRTGSVPNGLAVGGGSVWVTNRAAATVSRIDVETGRVVGDPVRVGGEPRGIAYGEGGVWVANYADDTISRLDPRSGQVVGARIPVGNNPVGVAVGAGLVWVTNEGRNTVTRIDPDTRKVVGKPIPVASNPGGITFGAGAVWVANDGSNTVTRIDP